MTASSFNCTPGLPILHSRDLVNWTFVGYALGLDYWQTMGRIVLPQAFRNMIPVLLTQIIILSDTFYEFALPLMRQLGYPTLFCNQLEINGSGKILAHHMRMPNQKKHSVAAFKSLNFFTMAAGDAYNDTAMLGEADAGFFFRPPDHLPKEFPQFPVTKTYAELQEQFRKAGGLRA